MSDRVPTTAETMHQMMPFLRAVNTALDAAQEMFGIGGDADYRVELTDDEAAVQFPVQVDFKNQVVKLHKPSFDEFAEEISSLYPDVSYDDLAKIHIAATLIPGVIAQAIHPRNAGAVDHLYDCMANADFLEDQVDKTQFAIPPKTRDLIKIATLSREEPEVMMINRIRLAIGALINYEIAASVAQHPQRETIDFGARLVTVFRQGLNYASLNLKNYSVLARVMGLDEHDVDQLFHREVSPLEIAAAFPMDLNELMLVAKYIRLNT